MNHLKVNRKTGFRVIQGPILITDLRGIEFYNTEPLQKPVQTFNLPPGKYNVENGTIRRMKKPVNFSLPSLPPRERILRKDPTKFTLHFGTNPNKCTIMWDNEVIYFDQSLLNLPLYQLFYILFHEYGHARYQTEKYADLFASRLMLRKGYNPSQVAKAPLFTLSSDNSFERKQFIAENIMNLNHGKG